MNNSIRLSVVWVFLMALTCFAFYIGELNQPQDGNLILMIFGLGIAKAQLLVDYLMGLRAVGGGWRIALSAYAILVFAIILLLIK